MGKLPIRKLSKEQSEKGLIRTEIIRLLNALDFKFMEVNIIFPNSMFATTCLHSESSRDEFIDVYADSVYTRRHGSRSMTFLLQLNKLVRDNYDLIKYIPIKTDLLTLEEMKQDGFSFSVIKQISINSIHAVMKTSKPMMEREYGEFQELTKKIYGSEIEFMDTWLLSDRGNDKILHLEQHEINYKELLANMQYKAKMLS